MKTDDVLKALEQCVDWDGSCRCCPLEDELGCRAKILEYALETINRLKAENASLEAWRRADSEAILSLNHELLHIRTKAIETFVEKLKAKSDHCYLSQIRCLAYRILDRDLESLVKEMTEDGNGGNNR